MAFIVKCAPVLKEWNFCCCSCSLRAASVVLAWIVTIMHISDFVSCVIYLSHTTIQSETSYESTKFLVSILGTLVGALILDALLLYGIHSKKPVYMLPFLVAHLIFIIFVMAVVFIGGFFVTVSSLEWRVIIPLIATAVYVLFTAFFWAVLYSYYQQIEEEKNPNSGIVNCTYNIPNEQVQMLGVDDKVPSYSPDKLAPDMA
jgi:glucan phosphoethanolaminetransferase (alkaline phosphatase superfamily)